MTSLDHLSRGAGGEASARLRAKLALFDRTLNPAYQQLWSSPARHLAPFLVQLHQIIRASVPLMEAARAASARLAPEDPIAAALVPYFTEHIEEERDHDRWLLDDLEVAGVPRAQVLARIPSARVAELVGAQYYWLHHHHPLALLGYIAVLEGSPPSAASLARIEAETGLPRAAFRTLAKHGDLDPGHRDDLDRFLDTLPLTEAHERLIGVSLAHTVVGLGACVRELLADQTS